MSLPYIWVCVLLCESQSNLPRSERLVTSVAFEEEITGKKSKVTQPILNLNLKLNLRAQAELAVSWLVSFVPSQFAWQSRLSPF